MNSTAESLRLQQDQTREKNWKRWGPYLSERQWGTVREDYSPDGSAWDSFPFEQAHQRAYRWGEDGLLGFTDRECRLCFALALWNGKDSILKERLYGLTNKQGNHGEDVKELYYYLDATPTSSYLKSLYKYPHHYPYEDIIQTNQDRKLSDKEYELLDTKAFEENRYFDITAEYAKADTDDILIKITAQNHGPEAAELHLLPSLWFRNSWSWGCDHEGCHLKPKLTQTDANTLKAEHESLGNFYLFAENPEKFLFTENESNTQALYGQGDANAHSKDAFHRYLISGESKAINPKAQGTKAAAHYSVEIAPNAIHTFRLRLSAENQLPENPIGEDFESIFAKRQQEADNFYAEAVQTHKDAELSNIQRQAYAGLLHTKQFYHYSIPDWLNGDPETPSPKRTHKRNSSWSHLFNRDIISMPDKWEYPWYAAWDLAFHMIAFDRIDPEFAKEQLTLMMREWYQHPNGQIPAYEWNFSDVNPPVHAWAVWRIYKMTAEKGKRDTDFLAQCFHKLLINFTWWVNRKDPDGHNLFSGGFLGLDNIGAFDRSTQLPDGTQLAQADGTAWMAFYCTTMLSIALELASHDASYEGVASKFFEHFVAISNAMNTLGSTGLWNQEDGFYYDLMRKPNGQTTPMAIRSLVGLIPLCAVEVLHGATIERLPRFKKRMQWFLKHNRVFLNNLVSFEIQGGIHEDPKILLSIPTAEQLKKVLQYVLDTNEFLSPYGIRSLSRHHKDHPFTLEINGRVSSVAYEPAESQSRMFGGNSNWRGPIWMPLNYLLMESLEKYHHFYGDELLVELPTGSGNKVNLKTVALELSKRLTATFMPDANSNRPIHSDHAAFYQQPTNQNHILFYEFFNGDKGTGCGASHQTGWTALVAKLIEDLH